MVDSKQQWKAWLYLSPAIVLLLIFTVWPIINADNKVDTSCATVRYNLKPHKVFLFDAGSEKRIRFEVK